MPMIEARDLTFSYEGPGAEPRSLDHLSLDIEKGELVAILGHNGSGKSTLARHFDALLEVQGGELTVAGMNARSEANLWKIRRTAGMVFQNPDNQFVSSVVEEDVSFGLWNYDVPEEEIPAKVQAALRQVGMEGYEQRAPQLLSGGQKQRIALAGVLALEPDILIFDEATAMLDPDGRREVLQVIKRLHSQGKTILLISHYIEEAVFADRVVLMHDGQVLAQGSPREMLTDPALLRRTGLTPPMAVSAYYDLMLSGVKLPHCPLTMTELVEELCRLN